MQAMNETYAVVCSKSYPIAMINFQMNPSQYDVNVTPDKRTVPSGVEHCRRSRPPLEAAASPCALTRARENCVALMM